MNTEPSVRARPPGGDSHLRVGVIGAGPAGLAVARALPRRSPRISIALFDPALADPMLRGRGTPYRPDPAQPLLNAPLRYMSVDPDDPGHCTTWFRSDPRAQGDPTFGSLTRPDFGVYLQAFLDDLSSCATDRQSLTVHPVEVTAIRRSGAAHVFLSPRCELGNFDVAVLCTGWGAVTPATAADGTVHRGIRDVLGRTEVIIHGTGLTAVDHARALLSTAPGTRLVLTSRRGLLPGVRSLPLPGQDCTSSSPTPDEDRLRTVRGLAEHVLTEVRRRGLDLDPVTEELAAGPDATIRLEADLAHVDVPSWRNLAVPVSEDLLPRAWNLWARPQKRLFLRRFHPHVQSWCNPMPPSTAELLLDAMHTGRLVVRADASSLPSLIPPGAIDATRSGCQSLAPLDVPLIRCLELGGLATRDPFGGVLTTERHRIVGRRGGAPLYALGALTQGAHYVVNALDAVVRQAARVADDISRLSRA